jgi:hypothetical protein
MTGGGRGYCNPAGVRAAGRPYGGARGWGGYGYRSAGLPARDTEIDALKAEVDSMKTTLGEIAATLKELAGTKKQDS